MACKWGGVSYYPLKLSRMIFEVGVVGTVVTVVILAVG